MKIIQSSDNKYIKLVKSLQNKKYREKYNLFFDEGVKNIELSLKSDYMIKFVMIREDFVNDKLLEALRDKVGDENIFFVKTTVFDIISDTVNSQGIMAIYEKKEFSKHLNSKYILILDRLQDPGNIGTIIRTAEAKGINDIYYIKGTADFFSPKVVRATMGSIYFMNIFMLDDVQMIKDLGYKLYSSSLKNAVNCVNAFTDDKIALIIGNEANGVSDELLSVSDKKIKISMQGNAQSLNVSVATAMLIYEMTRK
ncbi:TrmH family RNA methyltransferase [Peptoanaerobacter stomatis]